MTLTLGVNPTMSVGMLPLWHIVYLLSPLCPMCRCQWLESTAISAPKISHWHLAKSEIITNQNARRSSPIIISQTARHLFHIYICSYLSVLRSFIVFNCACCIWHLCALEIYFSWCIKFRSFYSYILSSAMNVWPFVCTWNLQWFLDASNFVLCLFVCSPFRCGLLHFPSFWVNWIFIGHLPNIARIANAVQCQV